jgi:uncharacterized RDD family membrane protein YckC
LASSSSSSLDYVGFGDRMLAFLIDAVLVLIVAMPVLSAIYGRDYVQRDPAAGFAFLGVWHVAIEFVFPAIAVLWFWRRAGATPGKMAVWAKIVDAHTGAAPSMARLVIRYLGYIISTLPLFLGFVWIAIDRRKQAWHDKIAGTLVIYDD